MFIAAQEGVLEILKFLFNIGGDLNLRSNEGDTPLDAALRHGNTEVVKFILESIVDKHPVNENTPQHEAPKN